MFERKGYNVVSEEEYYRKIMDDMKKEFPNMSESPSNLLVILARVMARNENIRDYDRTEAYSNAYVATATEQHLSKAVRIIGITRLSGTVAVGKVKITKDNSLSQIIIPAKLEITCNSKSYVTLNPSAIIQNTDEIELEIASVEVGTGNNVGDLSKFETVLNIRGLKEVVSVGVVAGGTNLESDANLRLRYFDRVGAYSNSSLRGIIDKVLSVPEVTRVDGNENCTPNMVDGLLPHSFIVYVAGGSEQEIANEIMSAKPAGIQSNGEIEKTVVVSGRNHSVKFSRFTNQEVYYRFEVVLDKAIASPDFISEMQEVIVSYTNGRAKVIGYELCAYVSKALEEVVGLKSSLFGFEENPTSSEDLVANTGLYLFTDATKIEVVVL
ncbi:MAG: baseplate J/gp47 family protein [Fusobacteriaceae bacterium]